MTRIEPPQFLRDLYQDLRDRRLLIPAAGLLVAMVAVPVLLASPAKAPPPPPPPLPADAAAAVQPVVLADDQVRVREYRKRLADLKTKNPFHQQFAAKDSQPGGTSVSGGSGAPSGTSSSSASTSSASFPTETGGPNDPLTAGTTGGDTGSSGGGNGGGDSTNPSHQDVEVVHELFTRRINVDVGVQGDLKFHKDVKPMTILPDETTPVVAFLGTDEAGKRAAFVVSSDVTNVSGDGACVPSPANCLYITLQKGEKMTLDYGPDGQTYEVKLLAIRDVKVKSD